MEGLAHRMTVPQYNRWREWYAYKAELREKAEVRARSQRNRRM